MQIQIISVGKLKEKYLRDAVLEYTKRLSRFCSIKILEVSEEKAPETLSIAEEEQVKRKEADKIKAALSKNTFTIVLDLKGEQLDSIQFSNKLSTWMIQGKSHITFILGGSIGLDRQLVKEADYNLCLSNMTFPHQLSRVILLEQIYRGFKIMRNETYHK
ncbi:MAG: 23S rRNA (pseudouridine(1915)-N(3))-methyltransferase RlmH [Clostridiaceae bacterium]|nr:23S rRNA (pseudouridine(1915)-N(3))-methyltransferase RlmH [Clostridiaceae bacterium]